MNITEAEVRMAEAARRLVTVAEFLAFEGEPDRRP